MRRCSIKKDVLTILAIFTGNQLCQRPFFDKVVSNVCTLLKKKLWHRCFSLIFAKFLRTPFLQNIFGDCFWVLTYVNLVKGVFRAWSNIKQKSAIYFHKNSILDVWLGFEYTSVFSAMRAFTKIPNSFCMWWKK